MEKTRKTVQKLVFNHDFGKEQDKYGVSFWMKAQIHNKIIGFIDLNIL